MSAILLAVVCVGGFVLYAIVGTAVVRRLVHGHVAEGHNDVLVPLFLTAGVIYAVLLGFMVGVAISGQSFYTFTVENLPQFGMGMKDGEILRWRKRVGDEVKEGEVLAEVEAAKTTVEVPAPVDGELVEIIAHEGETVEVRAPIAKLRTV